MKAAKPIVWPEPLRFRGEFVPTQPAVGSDNVWYRKYMYVHRPHCTGISFAKAQAIEAFKLQLQLQLRQHPATSEVAKHVIHGPRFNLRHDQLNLSPAKKQSLVIFNVSPCRKRLRRRALSTPQVRIYRPP